MWFAASMQGHVMWLRVALGLIPSVQTMFSSDREPYVVPLKAIVMPRNYVPEIPRYAPRMFTR